MPGPSAGPSSQSQGCEEIKTEVPWVNLMHTFAGKIAATGVLHFPGQVKKLEHCQIRFQESQSHLGWANGQGADNLVTDNLIT